MEDGNSSPPLRRGIFLPDETNKILRTIVKQIRKELNGSQTSNSPFFTMGEFPVAPLEVFPCISVSVYDNGIDERRMGGVLYDNQKGEIQRMGIQIDVFTDKTTFWQNVSQTTLVRKAMDRIQNLVEKLNDDAKNIFLDVPVYRFEVNSVTPLKLQEEEEIYREALKAYMWFPRMRS